MTVALAERPQETDPLLNENLWYDSNYISASIGLLSEPNPSPGWPTTTELAGPIVASLLVSELSDIEQRETRAVIIDALRGAYMPLSENPASGGEINPCQASRNLVTTVMLEAQRVAFANNDQALSAAIVRLACELIEQEAASDARRSPRLLATVLQAVVVKQTQAEGGMQVDDDLQTQAASWLGPEDKKLVHNALGRALCAETLYLDGPTINFLLEGYGLKPDVLIDAWNIGFKNFYPYAAPNDVVKENLQRIVTVERMSPGISRRLHESARKLRCFARLSPEFLLYLDKKKPCHKPRGVFFVATYDWNGAFMGPEYYDEVLQDAQREGCEIELFEFASTAELAACEEWVADYYANVRSTKYDWHSDEESARFGGPKTEVYRVDNVRRNQDHIRRLHRNAVSVAVRGCKSGVNGGMADTLAEVIRRGVRVEGLSHNMRVATTFSYEDGFRLWKVQQAAPLIGRIVQLYRNPKKLFSRPERITHHQRFDIEAELALYMRRRERMVSGL